MTIDFKKMKTGDPKPLLPAGESSRALIGTFTSLSFVSLYFRCIATASAALQSIQPQLCGGHGDGGAGISPLGPTTAAN